MKTFLILTLLGITLAQSGEPPKPSSAARPLYENNFEKADLDKMPDGFLVLDGGFAVKEEAGNKFLELPGAPLDTFGVLFGPTEESGLSVSARIFGTGKGRRFPAFAVGLNGVGGYKLQVSPGKKTLELYKSDTMVASVPLTWESGSWTLLRLQLRANGGNEWKLEGKAWTQGGAEPKDWSVVYVEKTKPSAGKPSIWGSPYAGTPVRFDDLTVTPAN
jgi:hypothetical protein